jgi:hypothetical protein
MRTLKILLPTGMALVTSLWLMPGRAQNADNPPQANDPAHAASTQPAKIFTPLEGEREQPDGEVTVRFSVASVGTLRAGIRQGTPPFPPIMLRADGALKTNGQFYAVVTGRALTKVHEDNTNLTDRFKGKVIEVTGKIRRIEHREIKRPDGSIATAAGMDYEMAVGEAEKMKVVQ